MTPSPLQDNSAVFHVSFETKASSTPTGIPAPKKKERLDAPLLSPPNLSPVKCFKSPNTGTVHGAIVESPEMLEHGVLTPSEQETSTAVQNVSQGEEEFEVLPYNNLDISK